MPVDIKIKKLNLHANWEIHDRSGESCTLCRKSFVAPSPHELTHEKVKVIGNLAQGKCGDIFHSECINAFANSNGGLLCPKCNTSWNLASIIKSGAMYEPHTKITLKPIK